MAYATKVAVAKAPIYAGMRATKDGTPQAPCLRDSWSDVSQKICIHVFYTHITVNMNRNRKMKIQVNK